LITSSTWAAAALDVPPAGWVADADGTGVGRGVVGGVAACVGDGVEVGAGRDGAVLGVRRARAAGDFAGLGAPEVVLTAGLPIPVPVPRAPGGRA
jgi:hypothetical protein